MLLHPRRLAVVLGMAAAALPSAAPAQAGEVIVVDGGSARRVEDPFVPTRAQSDMGRPPGRFHPPATAARSTRGQRAVGRALRRALRARRISRGRYSRYRRAYRRARTVRRRTRGARGRQLGYAIVSLERIALRGRLTSTRMRALFLTLQRNTQYWPRKPYPASGDQVTFGGSEVLFQYYPGRGLQIQPLSSFKKANRMHGACRGTVAARCSRRRLRRLLDEMTRLAVRRGRSWIAWEYLFAFGGGSPPWMSGMAQAAGIQALGRAARLLRRPGYVRTARRALGAFAAGPPAGVSTRGFRGGRHYLQYSFAPRLYIFNAFLQSLIGLYDFGRDTGDGRARALFRRAEPEARREVPASDVGDWSRYSYRGRESTAEYHELLREFLRSMCNRRLGGLYCTYARRYRGYQTEPPKIVFTGPSTVTEGTRTSLGFRLSKLSAVELRIYREGRLGLTRLATFRRGDGSFAWRPESPGTYTVRLAATEKRTGRGLNDRDSAEVVVEADPGA
jgi:D-glucuronyl C5-epimerase C-terminus